PSLSSVPGVLAVMMAPLRKGDLFPPPYVAPLGGPRQGPPAAQCRLKNWTARSCLRAAARVANVPRFRLRPVRGSFFLEYRRYFPDGSFLIIARLLEARRLFELRTRQSALSGAFYPAATRRSPRRR